MKSFPLFAGAAALSILLTPAHANTFPNDCRFNGTWEKCRMAGGGSSFTVTYARDGKQIELEMVGNEHECGDSTDNHYRCGKILITERKEGRSTWGSYRITRAGNTVWVRSSRGNSYQFEI